MSLVAADSPRLPTRTAPSYRRLRTVQTEPVPVVPGVLDQPPGPHGSNLHLGNPYQRELLLLRVGQSEVGAGGVAEHCDPAAVHGDTVRMDDVVREAGRIALP